MSAIDTVRRRGSPLIMLSLLLISWVGGRVATWEPPFALPGGDGGIGKVLFAENSRVNMREPGPAPQSIAYPHLQGLPALAPYPAYGNGTNPPPAAGLPPAGYGYPYLYSSAHPAAMRGVPVMAYPVYVPYPPPPAARRAGTRAARGTGANRYGRFGPGEGAYPYQPSPDLRSYGAGGGAELQRLRAAFDRQNPYHGAYSASASASAASVAQGQPPFVAPRPPASPPRAKRADRWSLDVFGFYRQGSNALDVSQARAPTYGASQIAGNLQWRARPSSSHDPRLYARAYSALVPGGESEVAAGLSARPFGALPLRAYGEVRATRNPLVPDADGSASSDIRPALYAVSEAAPVKLPRGFSLETYGAAGYVWGDFDTYFVDGQAVAVKPVLSLGGSDGSGGQLSVGAGAWGGAQEGVSRLDIGPTMRLDWSLGDVPARVSVDYRQQVAGDAEPGSGVAATVSTRF
ncbi:hypothetical protein [Erythrobacter sp.]|jgi:hypothetical protein|uniref:hypothetical protein n=1 Tax=Erythrobacter sp. TaxID=1042 RepID=UPI002EA4BAE2|nr:hypothetical protein [Erythrobacter sp.]